ncbi:MAG: DNA cytosine methyltransferase [Anaerobiospirillum succiniciproducens]|uniref:DNA cytosine methyltransferase n=1 Tax=Anaerobiospirillum succiniciproducens TaxID=13335 RepID=UPI002353AC57|nr:DNA cytosine methyltransferase [Anaerobiospirillum succiniciproducens]MCI6862779.1 DNA cytosine methyltransferase [Anaerobiospirillum succiniciproducens]MDY2798004.1 DNA cytosine methyltransferase [Anaerobiospirillum succiniciproducens]
MCSVNKPTYISLFSSAGIGCYGFLDAGFECIATNELIERRINVQKCNHKCKYDSGYICADITKQETKDALYEQIALWKKKEGIKRVDVLIATPPCQGMSVANHKKSDTEIVRNSLVVESISIIKEIQPRFFIFENVPAFMKTVCTDVDGVDKPIAQAIEHNLGPDYSYTSKVINFKNFGASSSRQRTLVIGVANDYADEVSPYELFPDMVKEKTLREIIGHLRALKTFGEIDATDIYHAFRVYPEHMRSWIANIGEGESAFDNKDDINKPHQIIDGKLVINQQKNGDKYRRQIWDKVGPCIHTRNDQLASQNTVHPSDDRVFSIRELMMMMTVPSSFKWVTEDECELNKLSDEQKRVFLKKHEINIRQSLGEAVPTAIFNAIAKKIKAVTDNPPKTTAIINRIVASYELDSSESLINFIDDNPEHLSLAQMGRVCELANSKRIDNAAYFTSKSLISAMLNNLNMVDKSTIRILEPSVGIGNFVPLLAKKFQGKNLIIDVVDIDATSLEIAKKLIKAHDLSESVQVNYICDDFLTHAFAEHYDYVIGNPPFYKMGADQNKKLELYRSAAINKETRNICSFFLDKAVSLADHVVLIFPKFVLNTPEFASTREYLGKKSVECIIDFGEKGFPGVLVETIALFVNNLVKPRTTKVISFSKHLTLEQKQSYIFSDDFPYWLIYRDETFDEVSAKLEFDVFKVFRDRQLTSKHLRESGEIRVLKSRNISDDGTKIIDIENYDSYVNRDAIKGTTVAEYLDNDSVYLTPNMTYNPRVMRKPKNVIVNGSVAILIPKGNFTTSDEQLKYFSSKEYRKFYQIARNYQTRSLNVDSCSVFFYGLLKESDLPTTSQASKENDCVDIAKQVAAKALSAKSKTQATDNTASKAKGKDLTTANGNQPSKAKGNDLTAAKGNQPSKAKGKELTAAKGNQPSKAKGDSLKKKGAKLSTKDSKAQVEREFVQGFLFDDI